MENTRIADSIFYDHNCCVKRASTNMVNKHELLDRNLLYSLNLTIFNTPAHAEKHHYDVTFILR